MSISKKRKVQIPSGRFVAFDMEWMYTKRIIDGKLQHRKPKYLSAQMTYHDDDGVKNTIIVLNKGYNPNVVKLKEMMKSVGTYDEKENVIITHADLSKSLVSQGFFAPKGVYTLGIYYSPNDIRPIIGEEAYQQVWFDAETRKKQEVVSLVTGQLVKHRRITGTFAFEDITFKVEDVVGMFNAPLSSAMESVGLVTGAKRLPDEWVAAGYGHNKDDVMGNIKRVFDNDLESVIAYGHGDTAFMEEMCVRRTAQLNTIVEQALGFNPGWSFPDNVPKSSGSIVSDTFNRYLEHKYPGLVEASLPFTRYTTPKGRAALRECLLKPLHGESGFFNKREYKPENVRRPLLSYFKGGSRHNPLGDGVPLLGQRSIKGLFMNHKGSTGVFNAVVFGGRCVNERPSDVYVVEALDIDQKGCYGEALKDFDAIMGTPDVWTADKDAQPFELPRLEDVANKLYGHPVRRAVPNDTDTTMEGRAAGKGQSQIIVSGKLKTTFQNRFPSKPDVTYKTIERDLTSDDVDVETAHIDGRMTHHYQELVNTPITRNDWYDICRIATREEYEEFANLRVLTYSYFDRDNEARDLQEFLDALYATQDRYTDVTYGKTTQRMMLMPKKFFIIPLKPFVEGFLNTRKEYKKAMRAEGVTPERKSYLNLQQNAVKLFINTTYGCFASPYFPMGDAVLANNITAKARANTWYFTCALGTVQSITDGGLFPNGRVRRIKSESAWFKQSPVGRLPGFTELAKQEVLENHRAIELVKFIDPTTLSDAKGNTFHDWQHLTREVVRYGKNVENEDALAGVGTVFAERATTVLNDFFNHYNIQYTAPIEFKLANTRDIFVYGQTSNYVGANLDVTSDGHVVIVPESITKPKLRGVKEKDVLHPKRRLMETQLYTVADVINGVKEPSVHHVIESFTIDPTHIVRATQGVNEFIKNPANLTNPNAILPGDDYDVETIIHLSTSHIITNDVEEWQAREKNEAKQRRRVKSDIGKGCKPKRDRFNDMEKLTLDGAKKLARHFQVKP